MSLHVNAGEVVTLIGANGAGKSTTLRAITGLLTPRSGRITVRGRGHHRPARSPARGARHLDGAGRARHLRQPDGARESRNGRVSDARIEAQIQQDIERGFTLFPRLKSA